MPALTRCTTGSKFQGVWKKEKAAPSQKRNSQVTIANGESSFGVTQICVRINSLHKIRRELDVVEKSVVTHLRNCESAHTDDFSNGLGKSLRSHQQLASKVFNSYLSLWLTKSSSMT
ncbi:hypothetical protein Bca52824_035224 [Brassica carinata]|uniref:PATROL1-like C-terminal domain-containing protein n=1 Tax=Brassica carinata TaxID=52824 RepID=A0A8X7S301_BRACI|nr:hypothetical protein Bca52824_035224 [Brassica carinata]